MRRKKAYTWSTEQNSSQPARVNNIYSPENAKTMIVPDWEESLLHASESGQLVHKLLDLFCLTICYIAELYVLFRISGVSD